jgi:hypothetical protein
MANGRFLGMGAVMQYGIMKITKYFSGLDQMMGNTLLIMRLIMEG